MRIVFRVNDETIELWMVRNQLKMFDLGLLMNRVCQEHVRVAFALTEIACFLANVLSESFTKVPKGRIVAVTAHKAYEPVAFVAAVRNFAILMLQFRAYFYFIFNYKKSVVRLHHLLRVLW